MYALPAMLATTLFAVSITAAADDSPPPQGRSAALVNQRIAGYVAAWNERDPKRRRALVEAIWEPQGSYVDAHRQGRGHDAIDAMIDAAQKRFPGYRLRLVSGVETHNGHVRFSWAAGGTDDAPLYLGGTDFAVLSGDGRFQSVVGFVDAAPAR